MNSEQLHISRYDLIALRCRRPGGFARFVREFWDTVVADPLEWNFHLDIFCTEMETVIWNIALQQRTEGDALVTRWRNHKLHDLIINVPPGTTKSTVITIMAPVWAWVIDPTLRIISGSHTDSLATEHALKSRDIIKSTKFRLCFPEIQLKADKDNKTNYENTMLGQRMTTSVGAKITGKHAHLIFIDDPIDPKGARSQAEILNANSWMDTTLSQRKVNKAVTVTILVMQRLSTNDPTGHLLEKKKEKLRWICLPACMPGGGVPVPNITPPEYAKSYHPVTLPAEHPVAKKYGTTNLLFLDPRRIGPDVLTEQMLDLGSDGYAGQYDQTPVQEGGLVWRKWFIAVPDAVFPDTKAMTQVGTDWDLAYTDKDENAASAYITSGRLNNKMFICDLGWVRFEFPELIKFMKQQRAPHYIEAKAPGKSAKPALTRQGIPAIEVPVEGGDKISRARFATPYAEAGMVYCRQSLLDRLYNDSRQGILSFPRNPDKDLADTLAQAIQRIFRGQKVSSSGISSPLDAINP